MDHNALRSCHATMYKFVTSMVHCGLGMQQCAMHNATIQKITLFELSVYVCMYVCMYVYMYVCVCICVYVSMCVCMCVCMYVCT